MSLMTPASTAAWQLAHRSTHLRASSVAFAIDLATPLWLSEKLFSAGTRWWNSRAAMQALYPQAWHAPPAPSTSSFLTLRRRRETAS